MKHLLNEEQEKIFHTRMIQKFEEFKVERGWTLTDEMEEIYITGIIDFCDSMIFANQELTYDIATIRNKVEENLECLEDGNEDD